MILAALDCSPSAVSRYNAATSQEGKLRKQKQSLECEKEGQIRKNARGLPGVVRNKE